MSSEWAFNLRSVNHGHDSDSDSDSDGDHPAQYSRLLDDLDISTREEAVVYKPNPFSIAKINANARNPKSSSPKNAKKPVDAKNKDVAKSRGNTSALAQAFNRQVKKATTKPRHPSPDKSTAAPAPVPNLPSAPTMPLSPISNVSNNPAPHVKTFAPRAYTPAPRANMFAPTRRKEHSSSPARPSHPVAPRPAQRIQSNSSPLRQPVLAQNLPARKYTPSKLANDNVFPSREPDASRSQRIHSTLNSYQLLNSRTTQHARTSQTAPRLSASPRASWIDNSSSPIAPQISQALPRQAASPRPAWMDHSSSPIPASSPIKAPLQRLRQLPLQQKQASTPKRRLAQVTAYRTPDPDEEWCTLPSKKRKVELPTDRQTSFKLPGLGGPVHKSGVDAHSSSRIVTFLPPPPRKVEPAVAHAAVSQYRPPSPPTSDPPPLAAQLEPSLVPQLDSHHQQDRGASVRVDLNRITAQYRPTRGRRQPPGSMLPGLDSCGIVCTENSGDEIRIPVWRGLPTDAYEIDPLHPDRSMMID